MRSAAAALLFQIKPLRQLVEAARGSPSGCIDPIFPELVQQHRIGGVVTVAML